MLAIDRRNDIMEQIQQEGSVRVIDLSAKYDVTEETIRRDLEKLENEGRVTRTYGGAVLNKGTKEDLSINIRETRNQEGKNRIARKICELIHDGESLMLDASTSTMYVARHLKDKHHITVITNSLRVPVELASVSDAEIIVAGGTFRPNSLSMIGSRTADMLDGYYVDKAILGCKSFDPMTGTYEPHEMEAEIKKRMRRNAQMVILAADYTKFNQKSFIRTIESKDINVVVTDRKLPEETEQMLEKQNISLYYA